LSDSELLDQQRFLAAVQAQCPDMEYMREFRLWDGMSYPCNIEQAKYIGNVTQQR